MAKGRRSCRRWRRMLYPLLWCQLYYFLLHRSLASPYRQTAAYGSGTTRNAPDEGKDVFATWEEDTRVFQRSGTPHGEAEAWATRKKRWRRAEVLSFFFAFGKSLQCRCDKDGGGSGGVRQRCRTATFGGISVSDSLSSPTGSGGMAAKHRPLSRHHAAVGVALCGKGRKCAYL